jgi:hypothetical protein
MILCHVFPESCKAFEGRTSIIQAFFFVIVQPRKEGLKELINMSSIGAPIVTHSMSFEERMAQGRLSIDSVGRLVEREQQACLRSPKAIFITGSWPCQRRPSRRNPGRSTADDAEPVAGDTRLLRSISDSLADAAFTMELGECDVGAEDDEHTGTRSSATPTPQTAYTESPYRYSWCAFSAWDDEARLEAGPETNARDAGSTFCRRREAIADADVGHKPAHEVACAHWEGVAAQCRNAEAGPSARELGANKGKATGTTPTKTGERRKDTGITPTNIVDFIQGFGDGEEGEDAGEGHAREEKHNMQAGVDSSHNPRGARFSGRMFASGRLFGRKSRIFS